MRTLRIVIPNGTSRLALFLAQHWHLSGHAVSTLSRFPKPRPWQAVHWDGKTVGDWTWTFEGADAVIHFSHHSNQVIAEAITQSIEPPRLWINSTAVFAPFTRLVHLRTAAVMSPAFGTFPTLLRLVRLGFNRLGNGSTLLHWVHDYDFLQALDFLIQRADLGGAFDLASPRPLCTSDFMRQLRLPWSSFPFGLPAPAWPIGLIHPELFANQPLSAPGRLLDSGFKLGYPEWDGACQDLVERWCAS